MSKEKIPIFETVPVSELSKLNDDSNNEKEFDNLRSIEKEFAETNLHTKQTPLSGDNTDNIDNTANTGIDNDIQDKKERKKTRLSNLMGEKGGGFAVDLVDMLIPTIVVLIIGYFGYAIEKKDLKLSKDEKEALTPAVMDVLDEINLDFNNPYINLGIMLSIVYGTKIADKLPTITKKNNKPPAEKKGMTEAINSVTNDVIEDDELSSMGKFEIDYGKLVDEIRLSRKRGVGDAKEYLSTNYGEKIKAIAHKHKIPLHKIQDKLEYVHIVKKRAKDAANDFDLET